MATPTYAIFPFKQYPKYWRSYLAHLLGQPTSKRVPEICLLGQQQPRAAEQIAEQPAIIKVPTTLTPHPPYLSPMLPRLPIGQQDFRGIREDGALYIDKTRHIHRLVTAGKYFFLSRPRRFGKSLTLSTIMELFNGSQELFEGLWVADHWDWEQTNPVVHIGFSRLGYLDIGLVPAILLELDAQAAKFGFELSGEGIGLRFQELLVKIREKYGRVVILIDEYDKPLIDFLSNEELPRALENQRILKSFYSVLKDNDANLRFLLITGVSKFSKVGVFSDLNNLEDITLAPLAKTLVGITQEELELHFGTAIDARESEMGVIDLRNKIREWYNGYSFYNAQIKVYNPWSLLSYFRNWDFRNFWFATGTPTFLVKLMRERGYFKFEQVEVAPSAFDSYQLDQLETTALLFQTGYLTIKDYDPEFMTYTLDYPNREVKDSMLRYLMAAFSHGDHTQTTPAVARLTKAFRRGDLATVRQLINDLFQTIPHQLFIGEKENLYHALIHLLFTYLGQYVASEVSTLRGRADAVVQTDTHAYIFEFKLDDSAEAALAQIRSRDYAAPFRAGSMEVVAIGVNFSSEEKRIVGWEVA